MRMIHKINSHGSLEEVIIIKRMPNHNHLVCRLKVRGTLFRLGTQVQGASKRSTQKLKSAIKISRKKSGMIILMKHCKPHSK